MSDSITEFREWAASMRQRNEDRERARSANAYAQMMRSLPGCGRIIGMFVSAGACHVRYNEEYHQWRVLCDQCIPTIEGGDWITGNPVELLKCGDWVYRQNGHLHLLRPESTTDQQ